MNFLEQKSCFLSEMLIFSTGILIVMRK